jgi:competence protein ComFB
MELAVDHVLPNLLKAFDKICTCEKCMLDMKAIALNKLKPHYVVTNKGELYSKVDEMNSQFETDVMKALIDAIDIVSKNPRH